MGEFDQSDSEKETNDCQDICYQNAIRYKEKEHAFIKTVNVVYVLLSLL